MKTHTHFWLEISPGYFECECGASKVVSVKEPKRD